MKMQQKPAIQWMLYLGLWAEE